MCSKCSSASVCVCHTCAGNEAQSVVARLHVLPEVDVGVVEDVLMQVEVVEALRGQHHANVITCHTIHIHTP